MYGILKDRRMSYLLLANILSSIGSGITMMAVPWLLVTRAGGDQIFGYATLFTTLILFVASPYIGVVIDRFSRKKTLLIAEAIGFSIVAVFAAWGFVAGQYETWQLIAIHFGGSLYYSLYFPTKFAFVQEIFQSGQYRALNSVLEVQNQVASMIAGGLASLAIGKIDLSWILAIDALTYLSGAVFIALVPYQSTIKEGITQGISFFANIKEGFDYLKTKPLLVLYLVSALLPFIGVMMGNYLFPIYVTSVLQADATVLGLGSTLYAAGAVLAGLTIPFLLQKANSYVTTVATTAIFALAITVNALVPFAAVYIAMQFLQGWGNAGSRVARNSVMMEIVPNRIIGRVNSFFNAMGMAMRVSLLGLFTQTIVYTGAAGSLLILAALMTAAFLGVILSRNLFKKDAAHSTGLSA